MVTRAIISVLITWLLFAGQVLAATLTVIASQPEVELGRSLRVLINYVGPRDPGDVDLQAWEHGFHVDRAARDVEEVASGEVHVTETLRLSPRLSGAQPLASLALGGAVSRPVSITVRPAVRNGIDARPTTLAHPDTVWAGQALTIGARITLFDVRNEVVAEPFDTPGFRLQRVETKRVTTDTGRTEVELRWHVVAARAGVFTVQLPRIDQRGHGRWRFFLPRHAIEVKPLPAYLPPTVPVGPLEFKVGFGAAGDQLQWVVRVDSPGILPTSIHGLARQLAAHAGTTVDNVRSENGAYRVALPDTLLGWGRGLQVTVPVFDPAVGQLREQVFHLPRWWQLSPGLKIVVGMAGFFFVLTLLMWVLDRLRALRLRQQFRQRLQQTRDAHELRRVLLNHADVKTLDAWANTRSEQALALQLNRACFQSNQRQAQAGLIRATLALV